jgi:hypothetical protein
MYGMGMVVKSQMKSINEAYDKVLDMLDGFAPTDVVEKIYRKQLLVVLNDLYNEGYNKLSKKRGF